METRERKRPPSHPGKVIRGLYLEPSSISISTLSKVLGVSRKTVSRVVNEKSPVKADMALRLSRAFDTSPQVWLNLQKNYDLWHAERHSEDWQNVQSIEMRVSM